LEAINNNNPFNNDIVIAALQADPSVKVRVEPGLFEFKMWHAARGMTPFMTPLELHKAGYNVDLEYVDSLTADVAGILAYYTRSRGFDSRTVQTILPASSPQ
jgi:hypothetical protein